MKDYKAEIISFLSLAEQEADDTTIARMAGHFQTPLEGIVANPHQQITHQPLLTASEQEPLRQWNNPPTEYPRTACIHQLFEAQVRQTPDAVAVVCAGEHLTYGELNAKANQLAHYLQSLGVKPEVLVGICVERSLDTIIGILGILKAGGAYVPLDSSYPDDRLAFILEDSGVPVLLTQSNLVQKLPQHSAQILCLDTDREELDNQSRLNPSSDATPDNLAYIIYTSGSTGKPKGVLINHHNVIRLFAATDEWFHFNSQDVWTLFHSFAFDFSVWEIWGALIYGGKLVVVPYLVSREPEAFYNLLQQEQVTVLNQTPSAFCQLMSAEERQKTAAELKLRFVIFGGEALQLQSLKPWFERHGDRTPQLVNMYGITETTVHVTYCPLSVEDLERNGSVIGCPIPDLQVYILDSDLQPVPLGVMGELYIGGAGLARGYLNRADLTQERFILNPFSNQLESNQLEIMEPSRLYKTGDLARYLPDGNMEYLGRIDHQVKIRGFRIELGEIEATLAQHSDITSAVVIVREDIPDNKYLAAYLVPKFLTKAPPSSKELRSFLLAKLPDYMVPAAFVALTAIPLTANGKVDRRALPNPEETNQNSQDLTDNYLAPQDLVETQLLEIWQQVLGRKTIGIRDDFFALGGNSLIAARLFLRIQEKFDRSLPLAFLLQTPTIEGLASRLRQQSKDTSWSSLVPLQPKDNKPIFCIHPVGGNILCYKALLPYIGADQPLYALQARGLNPSEAPIDDIQLIAKNYIEEIKTVQPTGPYVLAGYSFGGTVAYEIAQQLQRSHNEVAAVIFFDADCPNVYQKGSPPLSVKIALHATNLVRVNLFAKLSYFPYRVGLKLSKIKAQLKAKVYKYRGIPNPDEIPDHLIKLNDTHFDAFLKYEPLPYTGKIFQFQSIERPTSIYYEPFLGWKYLVEDIELIDGIPGHHGMALLEPQVAFLGKKLKTLLDQLQAEINKN